MLPCKRFIHHSFLINNTIYQQKFEIMPVIIPENYFPGDDPAKTPLVNWRSHANLLFLNWLNYYVYQSTPYDIKKIG